MELAREDWPIAQDQRPPAREQRSAPDQRPSWTWLAVLHHLIGLVIGAVSFPLVLAGVTTGAVLAPIGDSRPAVPGPTPRLTHRRAAGRASASWAAPCATPTGWRRSSDPGSRAWPAARSRPGRPILAAATGGP